MSCHLSSSPLLTLSQTCLIRGNTDRQVCGGRSLSWGVASWLHRGCGSGEETAEGQRSSPHITSRAQDLPLSTLTLSARLRLRSSLLPPSTLSSQEGRRCERPTRKEWGVSATSLRAESPHRLPGILLHRRFCVLSPTYFFIHSFLTHGTYFIV